MTMTTDEQRLAHLNTDLQAMRRSFYLATAYMAGEHQRTIMAAVDSSDLDTAQIIWEKHTGLTGP